MIMKKRVKKASEGKGIPFFNLWKSEKSLSTLRFLALHHAALCGPWADHMIDLVQASDVVAICNFTLDYELICNTCSDFHSVAFNLRQLQALYSKNVDLDFGVDKEAAAWERFCESEVLCRQTNERFREYWSGENTGYEERMLRLRSKIADILGDVPSLADLGMAFGPGSSSTVKRETSARHKLDADPVCSFDSYNSVCNELYPLMPVYAFLHKGRVKMGIGSLSFVPKSWKTFRSITIEPTLNTYVQKGIGDYIRRRLRSVGIDLRDQTVNQEAARLSSMLNDMATLDLSMASDLIAHNVVLDLLPIGWVDLLCTWRTNVVRYERKNLFIPLEKFSSMGNGFTFELESLIFYAVTVCVSQECGFSASEVSVYGDDIICRSEVAAPLTDFLSFLGFRVNDDKSFFTGPFRESCGVDYILGKNIRPFYVKDRFTDATIYGYLNFCTRSGWRLPLDLRSELLCLCESPLLEGPDGYGDGHLISSDFKLEKAGQAENCDLPRYQWQGSFLYTYCKKKVLSKKKLLIGDDCIPTYQIQFRPDNFLDFNPLLPRLNGLFLTLALKKGCFIQEHEIRQANRLKNRRLYDDSLYVIRGKTSECKKLRVYIL